MKRKCVAQIVNRHAVHHHPNHAAGMPRLCRGRGRVARDAHLIMPRQRPEAEQPAARREPRSHRVGGEAVGVDVNIRRRGADALHVRVSRVGLPDAASVVVHHTRRRPRRHGIRQRRALDGTGEHGGVGGEPRRQDRRSLSTGCKGENLPKQDGHNVRDGCVQPLQVIRSNLKFPLKIN